MEKKIILRKSKKLNQGSPNEETKNDAKPEMKTTFEY